MPSYLFTLLEVSRVIFLELDRRPLRARALRAAAVFQELARVSFPHVWVASCWRRVLQDA